MEIAQHASTEPSIVPYRRVNLPICSDLWPLIFDFIGINKDLANCRFVDKNWKKYVKLYLDTMFKTKKHDIDILKYEWRVLQNTITPTVKETVEVAEVRKVVFESFDNNIFYRSMRALAKINNPSQATRDGVLAVMCLLTDEEEVRNPCGELDWKYFRKKLLNRHFLKFLRNIKPEDITSDRICRFDAAVGLGFVTEYDLLYSSIEAREVFSWAQNIVEYKEFLDTLTLEVKNVIRQTEIQMEKEKEFRFFEKIVTLTGI
jgi:hypothetical protein